MAMTLTALCNRNRRAGWYMGKSRRARVGECEAVAGSPCCACQYSATTPAMPGAARRCACFGQSRANRSEQYTQQMKQPDRAVERQPSELRVRCRNCVPAVFSVHMQTFTFAGCSLGGLGYFLPLLCCCLHSPHRVYIADQHGTTLEPPTHRCRASISITGIPPFPRQAPFAAHARSK